MKALFSKTLCNCKFNWCEETPFVVQCESRCLTIVQKYKKDTATNAWRSFLKLHASCDLFVFVT